MHKIAVLDFFLELREHFGVEGHIAQNRALLFHVNVHIVESIHDSVTSQNFAQVFSLINDLKIQNFYYQSKI